MSRFRRFKNGQSSTERPNHSVSHQLRWRLWMLLVMLGLVIATMRQLNKPSTAQRLGQIFGSPESTEPQQTSDILELDSAAVPTSTVVTAKNSNAKEPADPLDEAAPAPKSDDSLSAVQDNTYFRPAESAAWFGLFEQLREMKTAQLHDTTTQELTYAQLLEQPDVYRGKLVTIRGTVRREEIETPPENSLGITAYHRLVIQPRGGGHWPFVVYCLELPEGFPRGDQLKAPVSVTGYFFKNWSYAWEDGLGIAPVVLARSVKWQPPLAQSPRRTVSQQGVTKIVAAAGVIAAFAVWLVLRNTRRPQPISGSADSVDLPDESAVESIREQLQRLADAERNE